MSGIFIYMKGYMGQFWSMGLTYSAWGGEGGVGGEKGRGEGVGGGGSRHYIIRFPLGHFSPEIWGCDGGAF
jgi:hypothetical protein